MNNYSTFILAGIFIGCLFFPDLCFILLIFIPFYLIVFSRYTNNKMQKVYLNALGTLSSTLETKDPYSKGHSRRVAELAEAIAKKMHLFRQVYPIQYAALLHDVGKIGISAKILNKKEPLTPEEYEQIKQRPVLGEKIVQVVDFLKPVAAIIRHQRENFDGSGYPDGKARRDIPIGSRIIAVANFFDSVISERSYRPAVSVQKAIDQIKESSSTKFDPKVVKAFLKVIPKKGLASN